MLFACLKKGLKIIGVAALSVAVASYAGYSLILLKSSNAERS